MTPYHATSLKLVDEMARDKVGRGKVFKGMLENYFK